MPREEIERLYDVFSRYSRPTQLEGCPCCTSPAEALLLVNKPIRTLTAPELEHYAFKALSTWGTVNDYKYFLPRILELTDSGSLLCDTEILLQKLYYGGFRDWPPDEQQAVRDYIFGVWREALQTLDTSRADALLCGAAPALTDVTPLLDYADAVAPEFKSAYAAEHSNQTKRKLLNSFWDRNTPPYRQVLSWLYPNATNAA
ncbi:MAG TPA: hypothetical protein VIT91_08225 [Chthoniobacterales bacterium]